MPLGNLKRRPRPKEERGDGGSEVESPLKAGKRIATLLPSFFFFFFFLFGAVSPADMALSNTRQVNQFPWSLSGLRTGGFFLSTRGAVCLPPEPNGATRTNQDGACTEAIDKEACRRVACMNQERGVAWPASPTATSSLSAFPRTEPSSLVPPELGTRLGLNVPTIPAVCFGLRCTTSLHSTSQRSTCMQPVDALGPHWPARGHLGELFVLGVRPTTP